MKSQPGGRRIDIPTVRIYIAGRSIVLRGDPICCSNDRVASNVAKHFLALACINRFRMYVYGPAGRSLNWGSGRERGRPSVLRQMHRRIDSGIEIQMELRMELAILDQRPWWTILHSHVARLIRIAFAKGSTVTIFRTRISADHIFRATTLRLSTNVDDDVPKAGLGHNSRRV